jgi:hypothetical protein
VDRGSALGARERLGRPGGLAALSSAPARATLRR